MTGSRKYIGADDIEKEEVKSMSAKPEHPHNKEVPNGKEGYYHNDKSTTFFAQTAALINDPAPLMLNSGGYLRSSSSHS